MNEKPEFPGEHDKRQHAFFEAMTNRTDELARREGTRADVNELNRRNRELLAANMKLQDEVRALQKRLRALGERV